MNDKENLAVGGGISAEQRARISQNFRAAKALLARKRPRESDHLSVKHMDAKGIASPAQVAVNRRVPLSDILVNTSTPGSVKNFKLINSECVSNSFTNFSSNINQGTVLDSLRTPIRQLECLPLTKIESSDGNPTGLISKDMVAQAEHGKVFDSFKTLVRRLDCSVNSCSMDMTVSRVESSNCVIANVSAKQMTELAENGKALSPFKFPIRKLECTGSSCSKGFAGNRIGSSDSVSADNGTAPDLIETSIKRLDRFESGQGGLTEWENSAVAGDGFEMNSYITPLRQHECSSLSESFISCGTLDEDFDDSILQEIDALCENKPEVVAGRKSWNSNMKMRSQSSEMNRDVCYTNVGPVVSEEMVKTEGNLGPSAVQGCEEGSRTSEATQIGFMPAAYAKYMQSLNDRQREAACSDISVPLMIVAGPGSGKTSTMVGRVLMLLNEGIGPSHILAMTFTTAAAAEMRDRIGAVAGKAIAKELMISTFHSFSLQLCRSHAEKLERTPEFLIYGQGQQRRAIIEAVRLLENGKNGENNDLCKLDEESNGKNSPRNFKDKSKKWLKYVTQAKASGKNPEECQKMGDEIGLPIWIRQQFFKTMATY